MSDQNREDKDEAACRGRRRGAGWTRVGHGLYRPAKGADSLHDDLLAWRLVLPPSGVFTHLTAADELGWWLPPLPDDLPVFVGMSEGESRPQRAGLQISRHPRPPAVWPVNGVPLAEPAEVLLACACDLGLLDMTVLIDAALHLGWCTPDDVRMVARQRRRGAPLLRKALRLADGRSESAWESLLRMLHWACDVPVEPQYELFDAHGGFVARADLWLKGTRTLHEYDGGEHLTRPRQRHDLRRLRGLGHIEWTRRGYTSHEVLRQAVVILRDADASMGRPHRPERIRAWHALLAGSLFTAAGTERFRARLRGARPASRLPEKRSA